VEEVTLLETEDAQGLKGVIFFCINLLLNFVLKEFVINFLKYKSFTRFDRDNVLKYKGDRIQR